MVYQESYTCSYSLDFQGGEAGKTIMSHSNTFTPWFGLEKKNNIYIRRRSEFW